MAKKEQKELFPWVFIVIGVCICCLVTGARIAVHDVENPVVEFFVVIIVSVLVGYIPMKIAYEKQSKNRYNIYSLSAVAMSIASPGISIAAILLACFDKKSTPVITENNKNNQNIVQSDTDKSDKETVAYGWQEWE